MIYLGQKNTLAILRASAVGLYLTDDEQNEILLPNKFTTPEMAIGDKIEVFVYTDSEDRPVATTQEPLIRLNQFAALRVADIAPFGAFMDWGLDKDLLVPAKQQAVPMKEGETHVVYLYLDEETDRLAASSKLNRFFVNEHLTLEEGEEVDILVYEDHFLGYFAVINDAYKGLIYKNEVYKDLEIGDKMKAWVKKIKPDNEVDLSIRKIGFAHVEEVRDSLYDYLKANKGFIPLTDDSSPHEIADLLNVSKKTFKKSLGMLYRKRLVRIAEDGVYLADNS
jgi:predicted RNA-binding protein (virulence factor B family)